MPPKSSHGGGVSQSPFASVSPQNPGGGGRNPTTQNPQGGNNGTLTQNPGGGGRIPTTQNSQGVINNVSTHSPGQKETTSSGKKRPTVVNPMEGFGYDRNAASYISNKKSSLSFESMEALEGYSESEDEDDWSELLSKAEKTPSEKRTLAQKLLIILKTASADTLYLKGADYLPSKNFEVLLPSEHLITKKFLSLIHI